MASVTRDIDAACKRLEEGLLVAFPTETVFGLGANAMDDEAIARIYKAKGRPSSNPLIVHVWDLDEAMKWSQFNEQALTLAKAFWPGPMTLVLPLSDRAKLEIPKAVTAHQDTIALRVPRHQTTLELLRTFSKPVAAPSANKSGEVSPTRPEHVHKSLGDEVSLILEGDIPDIGLESTIISCLVLPPRILRPGSITQEQIVDILGEGQQLPAKSHSRENPRVPGSLKKHYAPRARLRLNAKSAEPGEVLLAFCETGEELPASDGPVFSLSQTGNLEEAALNLYSLLHAIDEEGHEKVAVMPIPEQGLGLAVNDRLRRASHRG